MLLDRARAVLNKLPYYPDIHLKDVRKPEKKLFTKADFSGRNLKRALLNTTHVLLTAR